MGLADVVDLLACPHCAAVVELDGSLRCANGHNFDVAKQGYVNLLGAAPKNADTAAMVDARSRFLGNGFFDPVADAVRRRLRACRTVADVGAGPGFYLARALQDEARGVALDVSAAACRRAAKVHPKVGAVVADTWSTLPLRSGWFDAVLVIFAPKNLAEFGRILAPGGLLISVTPEPAHLQELRAAHGLLDIPADKADQLRRDSVDTFEPIGRELVEADLDLSADDVADVIAMGPNAFHAATTEPAACRTRLSVSVSWLRKRT